MSEGKFQYFDKNWFLDLVMKNNEEISSTVKEDIATINSLDKQILSLVRQRNYMLYGLNCKCLKSRTTTSVLGTTAETLWKEYKKHGFKSQTVKDSIASIRVIFFDDSKEKYQKLFCTQIVHEEYGYGSDDISFVFEDDARHSMRLTFNIKRYEDEFLYKHKCLNGYIYFSMKMGRDYYTLDRSFDIKDIRASVEKWIDNGFDMEKYKFEHGSLLDNIAEIFSEFEAMRAYDCYYAVKEDEDRTAAEESVAKEDDTAF